MRNGRLIRYVHAIPVRKLLLLTALLLVPVRAEARFLQFCGELLQEVGRQFYDPLHFGYRTNRGMFAYRYFFGRRFFTILRGLPEGAHWIDVGAGDGNATRKYQESRFWRWWLPGPRARVTAVGIEGPRSLWARRFLRRADPARYRYLMGEPVERRNLEELGIADFLTDLYGALSYAPDIVAVLQRYWEITRPGSEVLTLFEVLMKKRHGHGEAVFWETTADPNVRIENAQGERVSILEFLQRVRGFEVVEQEESEDLFGSRVLRVRLRRTDEAFWAPTLRVLRVTPGIPPLREYLLIE